MLRWSAVNRGILDSGPEDLAVDPGGQTVVSVVDSASCPDLVVAYGTPPLIGAPPQLSLASGGTQELTLQAGTQRAGDWHFVLGSASGSAPGIAVDAFSLPLNMDGYLVVTLKSPGSPVVGALGLLSPSGMAQAQFTLPAGISPALAGLELRHAFATIRFTAGVPVVTSASNAVGVQLTP